MRLPSTIILRFISVRDYLENTLEKAVQSILQNM